MEQRSVPGSVPVLLHVFLPLARARGDAVVPVDQLFHDRRGRNTGDHHVHVARQFGCRFGFLRTAPDQIVHRRAIAVTQQGERIAGLQQQAGGAVAHKAHADETDTLFHEDLRF
nr:hypothetical protein [Rhodobaculum claviforme]